MHKSGWQQLIGPVFVGYGLALVFASQDHLWLALGAIAVFTAFGAFGIYADYKGWK